MRRWALSISLPARYGSSWSAGCTGSRSSASSPQLGASRQTCSPSVLCAVGAAAATGPRDGLLELGNGPSCQLGYDAGIVRHGVPLAVSTAWPGGVYGGGD